MSRPGGAEEPIDEELEAAAVVELRPGREVTNERLDKFVASALTDLSRSYIQQLIEAGQVRVDGVARRSAFKLTPGEVVTVDLPPPAVDEVKPEAIPLNVVYEDDDVIVVNKPAGMVVHPAPGHAGGTLVNALLFHAPGISIAGSNRPGIVHRLDKDTSGLMVAAKTDRARNALVRQWQERSVRKRYVALVSGAVEPNAGAIDAPIGRDPIHRQRMAAVANGRPAITHFDIRERFETTTLLDVTIETGRTHQIRVHLAFIGHPVVGDPVYNRPPRRQDPPVPRQFLHAAHLGFALPDGREISFEAPLPPELETVLQGLREGRGKPTPLPGTVVW